jgi:sulfate adenylyltransferase subunit 1
MRFLTCGSADDGKSTLNGRLLYDSQLVFKDRLTALENDSQKLGTTGETSDRDLCQSTLETGRRAHVARRQRLHATMKKEK